ncbi:hypothetical protein [Vibrio hepatarius]|uniref:hypothetical protein n=1 Tax=Vibrio hepatarius TaxID=171383 RepID=UPI001C085340|nr:hypothetical protein [Vibrio hepatarius]MBU2896197.1 hypothetical protein [Vibrio hepatarius]
MIKYYVLLVVSFASFLTATVIDSIATSSEQAFTASIIGNPYEESQWQEKLDIFNHESGNFYSTVTIEEPSSKIHVFTIRGKIEPLGGNKFGIVSEATLQTNEIQEEVLSSLLSEPFSNLYMIKGYTLVGSFKVIYRDENVSIIERPGHHLETLVLSRRSIDN